MSLIPSRKRVGEILRLSRLAFAGYKWQIAGLTALGFVVGILSGAGIQLIVPLFSFFPGGQPASDWLSLRTMNLFSALGLPFTVATVLVFFVLLFWLKAPLVVWLNYIRAKITANYEAQTKARLFSSTVHASWPFLLRQRSGHLETITLVDVPAAGTLLNQISGAITIFATVIVYFLIALNNSPAVTFLTLAVGGAVLILSKPLFRKSRAAATAKAEIAREVAHHVSENFFGIKTLKTALGVSGSLARAAGYFQNFYRAEIRAANLKNISRAFMEPLAALFVGVLVYFTFRSGELNFLAVGVTIILIERIFIYWQQLLNTIHILNDLVPHLRTVLNYEEKLKVSREEGTEAGEFQFAHALEFRGVSFGYSPDRPILQNLNFTVRKGEMVGLVGPSGVGKTTLVDLMLRLLTPSSGTFLLDGRPVSEISLTRWRRHIGYVSQEVFLMNASVAENIRFYDETITDGQIVSAARQANIHDFIETLPQQYDAMVGERGLLLSAGQRQRIAIARVLARRPEILVLDEATSALDNESEAEIQKVIRNLKGRVTVLAIAHRLSTVMDSDRLLVLEGGKLAQEGPPQELLRDKEKYFFRAYEISKT